MAKIKKYISWFLSTLLLTLILTELPSFPASDRLDIANYIPELVDYTLSNGLRVILAKDDSAPVVAVNIRYYVGGANDPEQRSGFAHLFEHMMFNGSDNVGKGEFDAYLDPVGAVHNAATDVDYTYYYQVLPADRLPLALWLESDRMASLKITQETFDTERQVVIQELNETFNAPYGRTQIYLATTPFRGYLPYEHEPGGSIEDVKAATLAEAKAFHDKYYIPNNATLVIAGDIDFDRTKALVQAYFGEIPPGEPVVPILKQYPLPDRFPILRTDAKTGCKIGYEDTIIDPLIELPQIAYTVVAPSEGPDFYALTLLSHILSAGESSRFQQQIIRKGLAASASADVLANIGASLFVVSGIPNADRSLKSVKSQLQAQLREVMANGVSEAEVARAKKSIKINSISSLRSSVENTALALQDATHRFGSPQGIVKDIANLDAVTVADIQRVARTYFCQKPTNILITLKTGKEQLATHPGKLVEPIDVPIASQQLKPSSATSEQLAKLPTGTVSRTRSPQAFPAKKTKFPPYETFSLNNGLKAIFVEHHEFPKLQLRLIVGGSDVAVPANKQGIAHLLTETIIQGTKTASGAEIAQRIESVGGSVSADSDLEHLAINADAPSTDYQIAFDILADVALNPTFGKPAFAVAQSQMLTSLLESETDPSWLAERQFYRIAYPEHPYGFITSTATVKNITRNDLVNFHKTFFKPNNALLVIAGDISLELAKTETERVFGSWQEGKVPDFLAYPPNKMGDTSAIYTIDRPGSEQATIRVGNLTLNARNPEGYPLSAVNAVLGGDGLFSRLNKNLRVDKGYTYDATSAVHDGSNDIGTFVVATDVDLERAGDALREILQELKTIQTQAIPESELASVKGKLLGGFDLGLEDPFAVAGVLADYHLTGRPLQEYQNYRQKIAQVTQQDGLKVAAKYISSYPIIVVVGNVSIVKPQLDKLGRVVQVDSEGKVVNYGLKIDRP
ncbi:MAG: insulinase family protein [Oscillatoriaceae cyanobacterium Prado104]|nr:insulinase family protein [Oscillatoriaceae cyanobacterium Prado104]